MKLLSVLVCLNVAGAAGAASAVDLRGHGASADAPAGYGPREADDIADLNALVDRIGVAGERYDEPSLSLVDR